MSLPPDSSASAPVGAALGGAAVLPAAAGAALGPARLGCLRKPADFQRVLGTPPRSRSAHFSVHHVPGWPTPPAKPVKKALGDELSTGDAPSFPPPVDFLPVQAPTGRWLGMVVPKRHAKRAVTRTLIKRQVRSLMQGHAAHLASGLWVVRLRAPFDRLKFVSAASDALRRAVHDELLQLVQKAVLRGHAGA